MNKKRNRGSKKLLYHWWTEKQLSNERKNNKRSTVKLFHPEIEVNRLFSVFRKKFCSNSDIFYILKKYLKNNWNFYIERDITFCEHFRIAFSRNRYFRICIVNVPWEQVALERLNHYYFSSAIVIATNTDEQIICCVEGKIFTSFIRLRILKEQIAFMSFLR